MGTDRIGDSIEVSEALRVSSPLEGSDDVLTRRCKTGLMGGFGEMKEKGGALVRGESVGAARRACNGEEEGGEEEGVMGLVIRWS